MTKLMLVEGSRRKQGLCFTPDDEPELPRIAFLRFYVVWIAYALNLTGLRTPSDSFEVTDEAVMAAVESIAQHLGTAEAFNDAYYQYIFNGQEDLLGYYARNTAPSGVLW
eukprot:jgi/Chrzof1/10423/UNPLg00349.t1